MIFSLFGCNKNGKVDNLIFHQYVASGKYNETKKQLSYGIDPNIIINEGVTPIMSASVYDQVATLERYAKPVCCSANSNKLHELNFFNGD